LFCLIYTNHILKGLSIIIIIADDTNMFEIYPTFDYDKDILPFSVTVWMQN